MWTAAIEIHANSCLPELVYGNSYSCLCECSLSLQIKCRVLFFLSSSSKLFAVLQCWWEQQGNQFGLLSFCWCVYFVLCLCALTCEVWISSEFSHLNSDNSCLCCVINLMSVKLAAVVKATCGTQEECPAGKYSYLIRSGVERDGNPTVCFNGHLYVNL